jgi:lactate permease
MEWVQAYDPLGSAVWSPLVAGLPIMVLLGLLVAGVSAPRAALAGLLAAIGVALGVFKMPVSATLAAAAYGGCFGILPIGWIVLAAVFLYHLTVRTGQFDVVRRSVMAISPDHRMQALLIAFSFGSFLEGAAGFGTPVAISAALLIGLGFSPLYAAGLALLANTSPVAFGALGTPIITLAKVSGINEMALSQMAGRQLTPFSLIIPVWLVAIMAGWKGVKGCWPAILVCGGSFAVIQFGLSNWHGPALVNIVGGIGSLVMLTVFLRFWQPKEIWRFPENEETVGGSTTDTKITKEGKGYESEEASGKAGSEAVPEGLPAPLSPRQVAYAWMPWVLLSAMVFLWGWPAWKEFLNGGTAEQPSLLCGISRMSVDVPWLHNLVYRAGPVVKVAPGTDRAERPEAARYDFNWLSTTGTSIFLAAVLSAFWLRISPAVFWSEFARTLFRVRWALLTITCMLALAFTTKYSGADATLGLAFTHTGWLYPLFAPLLGWLGVALTGSDTSANALFGSLQRITAEQLHLNPVLIVASNSTGGVMGKMIDAQSIVVAAVATDQSGGEGRILRFVFLHSLVLAGMVGLMTLLQAYLLQWMIPS